MGEGLADGFAQDGFRGFAGLVGEMRSRRKRRRCPCPGFLNMNVRGAVEFKVEASRSSVILQRLLLLLFLLLLLWWWCLLYSGLGSGGNVGLR